MYFKRFEEKRFSFLKIFCDSKNNFEVSSFSADSQLAQFFRKNILKHHNIEIMQKSFFKDFAEKNNLKIEYLGYFGGIHPGGLKLGTKNIFKKFVTKSLIGNSERYQIFDRINSKYFSHNLGAVLVKN